MMRSIVRLVCVVLLLLLLCPMARAAEPLLTVVFTGNTLGTYRPCPSCEKDKSFGGLGRRATFFRQLRESRPTADSLLVLGGGHEFMPFRLRQQQPAGLAPALAEAFALLPYDLAYVTSREKAWLEDNKAEPPRGWLVTGPEPLRRVLRKGGMRVGLVIFPALDDPFALPDADVMARSAGACRALRPEVDLLVAMSPWNEKAERAFLDAHGAAADILLGSGPALAVGIKPMLGDRVLWVRAEYDGRSIPVLDILDRPVPGQSWIWLEGANYSPNSVMVGREIPTEPKVNNIFSWL